MSSPKRADYKAISQKDDDSSLNLLHLRTKPDSALVAEIGRLTSEEAEILLSLDLLDHPDTFDHVHTLASGLSEIFLPDPIGRGRKRIIRRSDTTADLHKAKLYARLAQTKKPHLITTLYTDEVMTPAIGEIDHTVDSPRPRQATQNAVRQKAIKYSTTRSPETKDSEPTTPSYSYSREPLSAPILENDSGPFDDTELHEDNSFWGGIKNWFARLATSTNLKQRVLARFTSARLLLSRYNRVTPISTSINPKYNLIPKAFAAQSLIAIGGLSYGIELLIDLFIIGKHVFLPDESEKHLSWTERLANALYKDDRWARMLNAAVWFSVNLAAFFFTGGISGILNIAGFAFDFGHEAIREYHDVQRHKKLIAKTECELKSLEEELKTDGINIHDLKTKYTKLYDEIAELKKRQNQITQIQKEPSELTHDEKTVLAAEKERIDAQVDFKEIELNSIRTHRTIQNGKIDDYFRIRTYQIKLKEKLELVQAARRRSLYVALGILAGFIVFVFPPSLLFVIGAGLIVRSGCWENMNKKQALLFVLGVIVLAAACFFPPATFALAGVAIAGAVACLVFGSILGGFGKRIWDDYIKNPLINCWNKLFNNTPKDKLISKITMHPTPKLDLPKATQVSDTLIGAKLPTIAEIPSLAQTNATDEYNGELKQHSIKRASPGTVSLHSTSSSSSLSDCQSSSPDNASPANRTNESKHSKSTPNMHNPLTLRGRLRNASSINLPDLERKSTVPHSQSTPSIVRTNSHRFLKLRIDTPTHSVTRKNSSPEPSTAISRAEDDAAISFFGQPTVPPNTPVFPLAAAPAPGHI